ncbi:hypothetical protein RHGRI_013053 [Rhododendron griersonianum]|uniref:NAC domain-containing protein n=1 Tax=Rhododendron griersonianum TaxID=479676 RepID=A0AAV6K460_9ERIC|nr:hypothetical protein RHGRI_013053 [Rhododendron griersonianum]
MGEPSGVCPTISLAKTWSPPSHYLWGLDDLDLHLDSLTNLITPDKLPNQSLPLTKVLPLRSSPPGFRFCPTDEELISHYLRSKINDNEEAVIAIPEVDVCKYEPNDLPDMSLVGTNDEDWFFFYPKDRNYSKRATPNGYWKATGKDRMIRSGRGTNTIGMKKTLVFYYGRATKGQRTDWVIHEYSVTSKDLDGTKLGQGSFVLCKLSKTPGRCKRIQDDDVGEDFSSPATIKGYRFRPTDEEIINYYLRFKINGNEEAVSAIPEVDVYKYEPNELPDMSLVGTNDGDWFFFCPKDLKYPKDRNYSKRATPNGYWKATGRERTIKSGRGTNIVGLKKTLVFYSGRAPAGQKTNWVIHEYHATSKDLDGTKPGQRSFVLCKLIKKHVEKLEGNQVQDFCFPSTIKGEAGRETGGDGGGELRASHLPQKKGNCNKSPHPSVSNTVTCNQSLSASSTVTCNQSSSASSTMTHVKSSSWKGFEELGMDPENTGIISDLKRFKVGKELFKLFGKSLTRFYFLYDPPGADRSSLIAAMADYLEYRIHNLDVTSFSSLSELRNMLASITNSSLIWIQDSDQCAGMLPDLNTNEVSYTSICFSRPLLMDSCLLKFVDGLLLSRVGRPPDQHGERNTSTACKTPLHNVHARMEGEPVGQNQEANEFRRDFMEHSIALNTENDSIIALYSETEAAARGSSKWAFQLEDQTMQSTTYPYCDDLVFSQSQIASTEVVNENMGSLQDRRDLLASQVVAPQKEPLLEGHVFGIGNWTVGSCSDLASSQTMRTFSHATGSSENLENWLASVEEHLMEENIYGSSRSDPAPSQPMRTIHHSMATMPHMMPLPIERQDTRSVKLKATYGDTKIKFQFPLTSGINVLKEVMSKILERELGSFKVEYKDEDGEWILMALDEHVREYLQLLNSLGNKVTELKVQDKVPNTTNFCANCRCYNRRSLKRKRP